MAMGGHKPEFPFKLKMVRTLYELLITHRNMEIWISCSHLFEDKISTMADQDISWMCR